MSRWVGPVLLAVGVFTTEAGVSPAAAQVSGKKYDVSVTANFKSRFKLEFEFGPAAAFNATNPALVDPMTMLQVNVGTGTFTQTDEGAFFRFAGKLIKEPAEVDVRGVQFGTHLVALGFSRQLQFFIFVGTEIPPPPP